MLWTIFVILLVLWGLGLLTGYTMGGVIHALLVIAIIVLVIQVFQGRRRGNHLDPCRTRRGIHRKE